MKYRVYIFSLNIEIVFLLSFKKILDNLCDYVNEFVFFVGYDSWVKLNRFVDFFIVYGGNCELINVVGVIFI